MAKLTLNDLASLTNETSAITTINNNNAAIETALENTLSRDGTTPNTMSADLDMNTKHILNLAQATTAGHAVEYTQLQDRVDEMNTIKNDTETYKNEAASSASDAFQSKSDAQSAEASTEAILVEVQALLDTYNNQFLGTFSSDPTVDNDGNPLTVGDIYYNSISLSMKVWDGSFWQDIAAMTPTSTNTISNKTITLGSNIITGTTTEFNSALTDDNFATLANTVTLTNKSIDLSNNTLTGTTAEFNSALTDNNFATLVGIETLTNKSIDLSNNTLTGTKAQFNTALSDADFATLTGTETLTNKSIDLSNNTVQYIQAGTCSITRDAQAKMREIFSVKDFGALGDGSTNDRAAFQACLDAITANGGGSMFMPDPASGYVIGSGGALTCSASNLRIFGTGSNACRIIKSTTTGDLFTLSGSATIEVSDFAINAGTSATAGTLINFTGGGSDSRVHNINIKGGYNCVAVADGENFWCTNTSMEFFANNGVYFGPAYTGGAIIDALIIQGIASGAGINNGSGILVENMDSLFINNSWIGATAVCLQMKPTASHSVKNCFISNTEFYGDLRASGLGIVLDGTNASAFIDRIQFSNVGVYAISGDAITINTCSNIHFEALRAINCFGHCVAITGTNKGIRFGGHSVIEGASASASGTKDGINVGAGTDQLNISDCKIGLASATDATNTQRYGINLDNATTNVSILDCDLNGNLTNPINYTGNSPTVLIRSNVPVWVNKPAFCYEVGAAARNYIVNQSGQFTTAGLASTADAAYTGFDQWYALTQSNPITPSQLTAVENGTPYMMRLTQANASAQRFGLAQPIEAARVAHLRGKDVTLSARIRCSASTTIRCAIMEWTGTADSLTKDIVNDWTNTTFTTGNFFISTTSTQVARSNIAVTANTLTDISCTGAVSSSMNNLVLFIWTDSTQAQNVTLDIGNVWFGQGHYVPPVLELPEIQSELALCRRYYQLFQSASSGFRLCNGICTATTGGIAVLPLYVPMRIAPTATSSTVSSTWTVNNAAGNTALTSVGYSNTADIGTINFTVASGLTTGNAAQLRAVDTTAFFAFDARL